MGSVGHGKTRVWIKGRTQRSKGLAKCCKEVNISGQDRPRQFPGLSQNPRVTFCSYDGHVSHLRSICLKILWHNSLPNYRIPGARTCARSSIHPPFSNGVVKASGGKSRNLSYFTRAKPSIPQPHPQLPPAGIWPPFTGP